MGGSYLHMLFMALLMLGFLSFYYKVGESEYTSGLLLGGLTLIGLVRLQIRDNPPCRIQVEIE